jgi:2-polyprenyl-3-methyl-5-hydroxy-6-metoxy-1,4-benzoquinol methylase
MKMNCHICNNNTQFFVHEKTDIKYYVCEKCEYIFKSPNNYQNFTEQKERYNLHQNDEDSVGYKEYFQKFIDFMLPHIDGVESALDFGCGASSLLSKLLKEEGINCNYYDPIYYPNTMNENKKYDLIVSTEVFEHLHDPKEVFESLIKKLNSGGYLAIQTQFHSNNIESFKKWYYHQDPTHIVFFRVKTFEVLASMYNCELLANNEKNMLVLRRR